MPEIPSEKRVGISASYCGMFPSFRNDHPAATAPSGCLISGARKPTTGTNGRLSTQRLARVCMHSGQLHSGQPLQARVRSGQNGVSVSTRHSRADLRTRMESRPTAGEACPPEALNGTAIDDLIDTIH